MNVQGLSPSSILNIKEIRDVLTKQNLNIGDKISVQVVGKNNNELTLKLTNGVEINATLLIPLDVNLGDFLEFSVKNKSDLQITLETINSSNSQPLKEELSNILLSLKLTPDERNVEIVKNLINQNLPLNKDTFQKVINFMSKFDFDIKKAVFFVANNFETSQDADLLNKFSQNQQKISTLMNILNNEISAESNQDVFSDIVSKYNKKVLMDASKSIISDQQDINVLMESFKGSKNEINTLTKSIVKNIIDIYKFNEQNNLLDKNMQVFKEDNFIPGVSNNAIEDVFNGVSSNEKLNNIPSTNQKLIIILSSINNKVAEFVINNEPIMQQIIKIIKDLPSLTQSYNDKVIVQSKTELSDNIKEFLNIPIIKNVLNKDCEIEISKVLNQISQKLDFIKEGAITGSFTNSDNILNIVNEIKSSINFMNNVNNTFNFYQIPIFMNKNNNDFEVYVAKRDKKSKINPKNVTLYLSLQTKNLGMVESLIKINYGKIDFNFRLEDDSVINVFQNHQDILEKLISDKGYSINKLNFTISDKKTNILNFDDIMKDNNLSKNTVDVKV